MERENEGEKEKSERKRGRWREKQVERKYDKDRMTFPTTIIYIPKRLDG